MSAEYEAGYNDGKSEADKRIAELTAERDGLERGLKAIHGNTFDRAVRDCISAILKHKEHPWLNKADIK